MLKKETGLNQMTHNTPISISIDTHYIYNAIFIFNTHTGFFSLNITNMFFF